MYVIANFMKEQLSKYKVTNRESFIKFLDLLFQDFKENPECWENKNLGDFLEAMSSYSADIQGYYDNTNQKVDANEASWQLFADILKGATMYE